jgi:two-component system nitrogen regulation sensor histidine kinase GlnL
MATSAKRRPPRAADSEPAARAAAFLREYTDDVLASLDDGLVLLDTARRVVFISPGAEDLTGASAAQSPGRPAGEVFAGQPWLIEILAGIGTAETHRVSERGELNAPFGRRFFVRLTLSPLFDAAGMPIGTALLLHDLTAQRPHTETAERRARVSDLAAVAAGLAHEVKNPLGGIKGAGQLLAERLASDPEALRFTSLITREVDRVSALLEQLLELTRPPHLRPAAVNVHRVLQEVLLLEGAAASAALTVDCRFDPSLPEVWADEGQLRQIFLNLIKNALDAMERHGTLTVTTRIETDFHVRHPEWGRSRQFLSVDVDDTGPGIPAGDLERIFTPFFTTKAQGTGLGLAVTHRLVTQHGGILHVESEPGRGTRFRVSLPVASEGKA